jgi:Tol biopolymer transport system component
VANDTVSGNKTFLRDRCAATPATSLIAIADNGQVANGASSRADISADGRFVVFSAYANNLVSGIQENDQVYLRDLTNQTTTLLTRSIQDASKGGNFGSACPAISDDGSRVVFWSYADNLIAGDNNTVWDMFVYDANANPHVRLVSSDSNGVQQTKDGEGMSTQTCPAISGDGKFVAFASRSTSLIAGDTQVSDIFIKELASEHIEKASVSTNGTPGNDESYYRPSLSLDGTWVAFLSLATNLAPETGDSTGSRIVAHNRVTGETVGFTSAQTTDTPAISGDLYGRYLTAFFGDKLDSRYAIAGLFLYDRNKQPIADAGDDQNITNLVPVTLDGSQSYDPDNFVANALNEPLTGFTWTQLEGPSIVLSNPHDKLPTYTPSVYGTYRFRLVVNDGLENSEPDEVTIQVVPPPPSAWKNVSPTGVCAKTTCKQKYKKARTQLQSKANAAIKTMADYKKALAAIAKAKPNKKAAATATAAKKLVTANKAQTAYEQTILIVQALHD